MNQASKEPKVEYSVTSSTDIAISSQSEALSGESVRSALIARIQQRAAKRLNKAELGLFSNYLEHLLHLHTDQSLIDWSDDNLYGLYYGLFRETSKAKSAESFIQVFNPSTKTNAWESDKTLIYFCHPDIPFLLDSLRMALTRLALNLHLFESNPLQIIRNQEGVIIDLASSKKLKLEDHGFIVLDSLIPKAEHKNIRKELLATIHQVSTIVQDFEPMLERIEQVIGEYSKRSAQADTEDIAYLQWLRDGNFTFLGVADFRFADSSQDPVLCESSDTRLGLMRLRQALSPAKLSSLNPGFADFYKRAGDLAFAKSSVRSTVHRDTYPDYVVVKRYEDGKVVGETRFLGLYTARLYHLSIDQIPLVRKKAQWLIEQSGLNPKGHNGKAYISILEGHPRDELIQGALPDLLETTLSIWKVHERRTLRLFTRFGAFQKFVSCILYLPRESLRTETREKIEKMLAKALDAESSEYTTHFLAESVLARIHFVFRVKSDKFLQLNMALVEQSIVRAVQDWSDRFAEQVQSRWGAGQGAELARSYRAAFPPGYRNEFSPEIAVADLETFYPLESDKKVAMSFYPADSMQPHILGLKVYRRNSGIELSDMLPILENLGFRVLVEHPYSIQPKGQNPVWIQDFTLGYQSINNRLPQMEELQTPFISAFHAIWLGQAQNDPFNRLVLAAGLDWRQVNMLRAYSSYLKQLGSTLSANFVAATFLKYSDLTREIAELFNCRFNPERGSGQYSEKDYLNKVEEVLSSLDEVESINEDQVFRTYLELIQATLRTNYFCLDEEGQSPGCLSLKFATQEISFAPQPRPAFEIYVYSTRLEGVHLRGGKVARGGIRWSDRFEDYRTEVLGLVKAQQVKNAVIVPAGAKGGFVARYAAEKTTREAFLAEGLACYRLFIRALLDITDNRIDGAIKTPALVRAQDQDDPYLVVAADKGTATYSDEANAISADYKHWLGDAFASGGSQGYDHKKMGITARGAWVAVQRHFRELGIDIQNDLFTALAVGDMAGDVFGNGMLLSKKTQLVGAFNHLHIFVDPNPDAEASWHERKRLFDAPRSSWQDYSGELISEGGGVFLRSAKTIAISKQMAKRFGIQESELQPDALIKAMLGSKVDLIWNGGIGTYVKSSLEPHAQVGDRSSESVRLNGNELQAKVFGEGGNLGMTQLGRIEFCQHGGICNTDFIDNAAGVDCSDHEVNIKILLNKKMASGELNYEARNLLLEEMTDSVAKLVLHNNYRQTLAISLAYAERATQHFEYLDFMRYLEAHAGLNRELEFLPDDEALDELHKAGKCWTRPELSILVSYAKVDLKQQLLAADISHEPIFSDYLLRPFPAQLQQDYFEDIECHQLRSEILATQIANDMVNRMGFTFCRALTRSLGASIADIARAYSLTAEVFDLDRWWSEIEALDYQVEAELQHHMLHQLIRLCRRSTRWFLRNQSKLNLPADSLVEQLKPVPELLLQLHEHQPANGKAKYKLQTEQLLEQGVPADLASLMANIEKGFLLPGRVLDSKEPNSIGLQLEIQFGAAELLGIESVMDYLIALKTENSWQELARESHFFELEELMRTLANKLSQSFAKAGDLDTKLTSWRRDKSHLVNRFRGTVSELQRSEYPDLSMVTVAVAELKDLVKASLD